MRLLKATGEDDFSLVEFVQDIPPYAILSHTWGADEDEVTFKDIYKGKGKGKKKPGYAKLRFCATQAAKRGLEYFWIDTCCIDKGSSAELSEAINSMYKWYERSDACFVYLADVHSSSISEHPTSNELVLPDSRWFERGWTLQELLAPRNVVFFSQDGIMIGDKLSLAEEITRHTNIPTAVIYSTLIPGLGGYPIEERMNWAKDRRTKREEDEAYCLLGIVGVQMPLIYGEGRKNAFTRLRKEIENAHGRSDLLYDMWKFCKALKQVSRRRLILWLKEVIANLTFESVLGLSQFIFWVALAFIHHPARQFLLFHSIFAVAAVHYIITYTRWDLSEKVVIIFLVVAVCDSVGQIVCLKSDVQRLHKVLSGKTGSQEMVEHSTQAWQSIYMYVDLLVPLPSVGCAICLYLLLLLLLLLLVLFSRFGHLRT